MSFNNCLKCGVPIPEREVYCPPHRPKIDFKPVSPEVERRRHRFAVVMTSFIVLIIIYGLLQKEGLI